MAMDGSRPWDVLTEGPEPDVDAAIARLTGLDILRRSRDDEDSYTVSPVITAVMTASVITELQQQFEQLTGGGTDTDG